MHDIQREIIDALHVKENINPDREVREIIDFLKNYKYHHDFIESFVLGISGGQDSTLLGKLAQMAVEELREEGHTIHFYGVRLPYGTQLDMNDVDDAIAYINPDFDVTINIKNAVDASVKALNDASFHISDFVIGNEKARERMKAQYAIAADRKGVVLGSDHAAEALTGFYTKFGDGAADVMPLTGLNKRQGQQILKYLNCPEHLYLKVPTADLESDRPLLSDEDALQVSYKDIDDFLEGKTVPVAAFNRIIHLYKVSQHKRDKPYHRYLKPKYMEE
ncbi:ammonia-dependent NAD(+) synthetase [Nosocomiicoccus ampullae]|uniref:ammonia-dependent NAD(+) synthetase n=1 Tax=Nosocomiicoccus ampullae TaxID=489910 RepID=UPI00254D5FBB|nr:ammonia-dependent NAD(+) synthetase [Nosocomiicoccus ampullae]MDK6863297.1 ammonia-dependent NAD(+) synthetase [Nosocomiicoccus ampullae]